LASTRNVKFRRGKYANLPSSKTDGTFYVTEEGKFVIDYKKTDGTLTRIVLNSPEIIGLGNVDNTSDANKPISTAVKAAFNNLFAVSNRSLVITLPT